MCSYEIEAPVIIEYVSPLDRHDFSSDRTLSLCTILTLDDVECHVELGDRNRFTLYGLEASSENDAFDSATILLDRLCIAATAAAEVKNQNPHHGQLRLRWDAGNLGVTPRDHSPSDSFATKITENVNVEFLNATEKAISQGGDVFFIFDAYYRAMGPQDPRTKYVVGFSVIELVERRFASEVTTRRLIPAKLVRSISDYAKNLLKSHRLPEAIDGVVSRIGALKRATIETRSEKLKTILCEVFQITEVDAGVERHRVELPLVQRLIDARNRLFHGSVISDDAAESHRELTLVLMGIVGQILEAVVEGRVQWKEE